MSRISPTFALSGFVLAKSRVRDDVGSRMASWEAVKVWSGSGHTAFVEGGGGYVFILRGARTLISTAARAT